PTEGPELVSIGSADDSDLIPTGSEVCEGISSTPSIRNLSIRSITTCSTLGRFAASRLRSCRKRISKPCMNELIRIDSEFDKFLRYFCPECHPILRNRMLKTQPPGVKH